MVECGKNFIRSAKEKAPILLITTMLTVIFISYFLAENLCYEYK
jgi:hypothetical protein